MWSSRLADDGKYEHNGNEVIANGGRNGCTDDTQAERTIDWQEVRIYRYSKNTEYTPRR